MRQVPLQFVGRDHEPASHYYRNREARDRAAGATDILQKTGRGSDGLRTK